MGRTSVAVVLAGLAILGWLLLRDERAPAAPPSLAEPASARGRAQERLELTSASPPEGREGRQAPEVQARTAESGLVLEGRVVRCAAGADPRSGVPTAEVEVGLAWSPSDGAAWIPGPSTRSGVEGAFRFALPEDGAGPRRFRLRIEADADYGESTLELALARDERRRSGLLLVRRAHGTLAGRTVDAERRPLPGVEVVRLGWNGTREILVTEDIAYSDGEGRFLFRGVARAPGFEARKPGYRLVVCPRLEPEADGTWPPIELVLDRTGTLRLWVTDRSGAPLADVHLGVSLAPPERFAARGWSDALRTPRFQRTDEAGSARVDELWVARRLRVELDREEAFGSRPLGGFEWLEGARPVLDHAPGAQPLVLAPGAEREVRVELLRVAGRVVDEKGAPCPEPWISVHPLDRPTFTPDGGLLEVRGDELGHFALELLALRPLGVVRLEASELRRVPRPAALPGARPEAEEEPAPAGGTAVRPRPGRHASLLLDLEAHGDEEPVTLVLESPPSAGERPARAALTVEVALAPGEIGSPTLLLARLRPEGAAPDVPELGAQTTLSGPSGWPAAVLGLGSRSGPRPSEQGGMEVTLVPMPENPTTVPLEAGHYWIGVQAKAKDGNLTFPIGTGLVRVGAGEYHLRFEPAPTGSVEGRLIGWPREQELFVALAQDGALLTLDVRRQELRSLGEVGADGYFRFPQAPIGALELRVGTRAELLAGRWTKREMLELERAESLVRDVRP